MKQNTSIKRLSKVAREFNVGISTIIDFLQSEGYKDQFNPNTKILDEQYELLLKKYGKERDLKKEQEEARKLEEQKKEEAQRKKEEEKLNKKKKKEEEENKKLEEEAQKAKEIEKEKLEEKQIEETEKVEEKRIEKIENKIIKNTKEKQEFKILGKINLDEINKPPKKKKKKKKEINTVIEVKTKKIRKTKTEEIKVVIEQKRTTPIEEVKKDIKIKEKTETIKKEAINEDNKKVIEDNKDIIKEENIIKDEIKVVGKIDLKSLNQRTRPVRKTKKEKEEERKKKGKGLKVKQVSIDKGDVNKKRKRKKVEKVNISNVKAGTYKKRITKTSKTSKPSTFNNKGRRRSTVPDQQDIDRQVKETLAKLENKQKNKAVKYRKTKRDEHKNIRDKEREKLIQDEKQIQITEFVTVNELANLMDIHVNNVIGICMDLNIPVAINTRLDSETITILAEEFGFSVDFISTKTEEEELFNIEEEDEKNMISRPPIITVMGHVDHGKTSLLDYIRDANVIAGEAGGITQHIGAYHVTIKTGETITFLDTPGHEAFTAMRARGAKVTDIVIIIIAADDDIMPQTIEAIDHAKAANVPIVFAINKIDKENANVEKIKRELADRNMLIEEWGGKYGCVEISAKFGNHVDELLERVVLEAEILELKANPSRNAIGTVVESTLDKGRGFVSTLLLKTGTLKVGDFILVGQFTGKVKAMFNERGKKVKNAGPSQPVLILGLNGAPEAGDPFIVMENEKEAKDKANYRQQLQREIAFRAKKLLTLDEIGRRLQVGDFKELNVVIKGDVIGSIEALDDSISKLTTEEIQVNIIHKAVGQITDNDVMLAVASDAIIIGFNVRPIASARKIAEREKIEIRPYSIIFKVISDIKDAMEGMLSAEIREEIVGTAEILKIFKITGVGTIAGCIVTEGKILRTSKVKLIRDGIIKYTGNLGSLQRYKDEAKDVHTGQECGLNIENYNDIRVADIIEAFTETEVKRTL